MGELVYCPYCRKLIETDSKGWCSICNFDLPAIRLKTSGAYETVSYRYAELGDEELKEELKEVKSIPEPEVVIEEQTETEPETEVERVDEVVSVESLLAKG